MKALLFSVVIGFGLVGFSSPVFAQEKAVPEAVPANPDTGGLDELDPFDPNIEQKLQELDRIYEEQTGESAHLPQGFSFQSCYRQTCPVWIRVDKSQQVAYLYVNGAYESSYLVSTGVEGRETPDFDTHPDGRIYDRYTSTKYPGGDWQGMGNMPYAVFIRGGFALHGTGESNWHKLGHRASHGCIRQHPDNAFRFNRLVRAYGVANTWVTVE